MIGHESRFFVLDSNIFIEAHRRYYAFDICPGFWDSLAHYCRAHRLWSIDRVLEELRESNDPLSDWVKAAPEELFVSTREEAIYNRYAEIIAWVDSNEFLEHAKAEFARGADGWLIAYALVHDGVIVTHEEYASRVKRKVPIPNVCKQFNVEYTDTFKMIRELDIAFHWTSPVS